jgi:hypothetical protein
MKTIDTTPPPEFLDAYREVTGSNDTSCGAVLAALMSDDAVMFAIQRRFEEKMVAKFKSNTSPAPR